MERKEAMQLGVSVLIFLICIFNLWNMNKSTSRYQSKEGLVFYTSESASRLLEAEEDLMDAPLTPTAPVLDAPPAPPLRELEEE